MSRFFIKLSYLLITIGLCRAASLIKTQDPGHINESELTISISVNNANVDKNEFTSFLYVLKALIAEKIFNKPETNLSSKQLVFSSHVYIFSLLITLIKLYI